MQNVEIVSRTLTELKKHNITDEKLHEASEKLDDEYLKAKLEDVSSIYNAYEERIKEKFLDENDILTILANNIKNTKMFNDCIFFIDEFARLYTSRI